jgi:hypothetical protein
VKRLATQASFEELVKRSTKADDELAQKHAPGVTRLGGLASPPKAYALGEGPKTLPRQLWATAAQVR